MIWGADHLGPISTKIGRVKGANDVIILSNFGFNIFMGFRSIGGQNFRHLIDFADHRYNSAAATAQLVMCSPELRKISQKKFKKKTFEHSVWWESKRSAVDFMPIDRAHTSRPVACEKSACCSDFVRNSSPAFEHHSPVKPECPKIFHLSHDLGHALLRHIMCRLSGIAKTKQFTEFEIHSVTGFGDIVQNMQIFWQSRDLGHATFPKYYTTVSGVLEVLPRRSIVPNLKSLASLVSEI